MDRIRRIRWLLALLLSFVLIAAACGSNNSATPIAASTTQASAGQTTASSQPVATGKLDTVTFQLDWVPNTNHTGIYVADAKGWYADEGIKLDILPYSGADGDTIVAEGLADFAISFENGVILARPAGVPVVAVAAVLQHTAEAIGVKADRTDIKSPKDLDGKIYAGFGQPFEVPLMKAVIRAAGGKGVFKSVVLDTAAYQAVYSGKADFVIPFMTWEGIEAKLSNEPMKYFQYSDYGLPDQYSVLIVASPDWLTKNADLATRFLRATKRGYEWGAAHPTEAGQILIDANPGVFNNSELVMLSQKMLAKKFLLDQSGNWGTIDPKRFAAYANFLYKAGIIVDANGNALKSEPNWADFVNTSFLG